MVKLCLEIYTQSSSGVGIITTTLLAFTPAMIHLAGYFNNDISATAFATSVTWQTLVLVRKGGQRPSLSSCWH